MTKTVFTFGRMNPPTIGHQKLADKVKAEAKKQGAMPHVYLSHTQNAKKDPLDYATKIKYARKAFGPSVTKSRSKTIIQVLQELQKMGHTEVTLVVGSDRVGEFKTFLNRYNGKDFTFDKVKVISAGQRDPDAEGAAGMSATKIRGLAQAGELEEFGKGLANLSASDTKAIYNKVRDVMGITESLEYGDEDFDFTEEELDAFVEMTDLEDLDEDYDLNQDFEQLLEDMELAERAPLTLQQRLKIGRRMKRLAPKMKRKREIAMRKMADKGRLERRARKGAIKLLRTKFAGKQGANYASLAPGAKIAVDRIIQKKMNMVGKISRRLLPKVRRAEMERLKRSRSSKKESFDQSFENYLAEACWDGYKQEGLKKKGKRMVPNCVPEEIIFEDETQDTNQKLLYMLRQAFTDATERQLVIRALKGGSKSLQNPVLRPFILKLLNRLLDATQSDPSMFVKMKDRLRRMSQDDSKEVKEDKQPAKYHAGLSKSTKDKRASHFKKQADKPDDQASAYKPAPGDAQAKTKPSVHTNKFKQMYGEDYNAAFEKFISEEYIEEKSLDGLKKKAEKSGIPYGILKKVYDRGMAAWKSGHRPGTTPQQWAYARVNSFATKSKGTWGGADKDLAAKVREEVELDEISTDTAVSYMRKAGNAVKHRGLSGKKVDNRYSGVARAHDKLAKSGKMGTTAQKYSKARVGVSEEKHKGVDIGNWKYDGPEDFVKKLIDKFGTPDYVEKNPTTDEAYSATFMDIDGFDFVRIVDSNTNKLHPHPAKIFVEGGMYFKVPHEMVGKLKEASPTIMIDELNGWVVGKCASLTIAAATVNFVMDAVNGNTKPTREEYDRRIESIMNKQKPDISWWENGLNEAKTHFVYQQNVVKTKSIVHRGDEKSSREWVKKNSKYYDHKGKNFQIYKGKPGKVSPRDIVAEMRKSPLQRLKDFDKTRVAVGKKPIFDPKSTEFRNVSRKQKKLDQTSNEDVDVAKQKIEREKQSDKIKHDAMLDRARTRETQAKNRATKVDNVESFDDAFENFLNEVGGAGQFGTDKLKKKYAKDTPYSEETYDGNEFDEAYGTLWFNEDEELDEGEYQGRSVKLGKPSRGDVKKFKVYVKNEKGNTVKVNFGDPNMEIKRDNPARRKSFRARHNCDNPGPRTKARYWSCKKW